MSLLIHQIWLNDTPPPDQVLHWMEKWRNYGNYMLWTPKNLPAPTLMHERAKKLWPAPPYCHKVASDLYRYMILHEYGGLYLDVDMEANGPLESFLPDLNTPTLYKAKPAQICNAAMYFPHHGHPLLVDMLCESAVNLTKTVMPPPKVMAVTGPTVLTRIAARHEDIKLVYHPTIRLNGNGPDCHLFQNQGWRQQYL